MLHVHDYRHPQFVQSSVHHYAFLFASNLLFWNDYSAVAFVYVTVKMKTTMLERSHGLGEDMAACMSTLSRLVENAVRWRMREKDFNIIRDHVPYCWVASG
jgi:hypothetical protein